MDPEQITFLLSLTRSFLYPEEREPPSGNSQCLVNFSTLKRNLIVLNRGRNLSVKSATRAA